MGSEQLHEPSGAMRPETIERHRCIVSIIEELDAVDWYQQRADATEDPELRAILEHNGDEEKEHAAMALEWLRRHDPALDRYLRQYLFTEGSIVEIEADPAGGNGTPARRPRASLPIGSLREGRR